MADISAKQVMALRAKTDLPMMDCKKALVETAGDEEAAIELLRKKMKGKLETKSERETSEGRITVYISDDGKTGGIAELLCETTPVAQNEIFVALADQMARQAAASKSPTPESVLAAQMDGGGTIKEGVEDVFGKLRENMKLRRCAQLTGEYLTSYVHHDGKTGVLIALDAKPTDEKAARNLAFHAVFTKPLAITRDVIPAEKIEDVSTRARAAAIEQGKNEEIVNKIVEGKVNAFCAENALMEQEHVVPDEEKKKVKDSLAAAGVNAVTGLVIYELEN